MATSDENRALRASQDASASLVHLFLDTNIFLHWTTFDEIDWLTEAQASRVRLMLAPSVLAELDSKKYTAPTNRIRERAELVVGKLSRLLEDGDVARVRERVEIQHVPESPFLSEELAKRGISPISQDGRLINTILSFLENEPLATVRIVTADLGLQLASRGKRIERLALDPVYRLAAEQDDHEKQLAKLTRELHAAKARLPNLSVSFPSGEQHHAIQVASVPELTEDEIASHLAEVRQKSPIASFQDPLTAFGVSGRLRDTPPGALQSYNEELETFYQKSREHLEECRLVDTARALSFLLSFQLRNTGNAPAEDVEIEFVFPEGVSVSEAELSLPTPKPPSPPQDPRRFSANGPSPFSLASLERGTSPMGFWSTPESIRHAALVAGLAPPNVSLATILDERVARFHVRSIKHYKEIPLDPLFARFKSVGQVAGFSIDVSILAGSLPEPCKQTLHVRVKKVEWDPGRRPSTGALLPISVGLDLARPAVVLQKEQGPDDEDSGDDS